jgi:hypothetical protein
LPQCAIRIAQAGLAETQMLRIFEFGCNCIYLSVVRYLNNCQNLIAMGQLIYGMFRLTALILLVLILAFSFSCNPKHACVDNYINPAFIGFLPSDIDTFVLKKYKQNDNFQHLLDTILVIDKYASIYTVSNDTTVVYVNSSDPTHWIRPAFDWQVYLPAKNKTVQISSITSTQVEDKGRTCYNPINSFNVDGQVIFPVLVQTDKFYTRGYRVYIKN